MSEQFTSQVHDDGVAEVVLDRPPVNALNSDGWITLAERVRALGEDPAVRVIVIRAEATRVWFLLDIALGLGLISAIGTIAIGAFIEQHSSEAREEKS